MIFTFVLANCNLANLSNHVGAVGFLPVFFSKQVPFGLIKVNQNTGEPDRDANGLCIRCGS